LSRAPTTVVLLRHAAHDWLGRGLAGRLPEVALNAAGRQQAQALVQPLAAERPDVVVSSPQPRTRQTVEPFATARGLPVQVVAGLDEIDFGVWTGRSFASLAGDPQWDAWNARRARGVVPGGEAYAAVVRRAAQALADLHDRHPGARVLAATHADVVKAVVCGATQWPVDALQAFEVPPCSLTELEVGGGWWRLRRLAASVV
jgi:probable phosphoglycerate mutase